MKEFCLFFFFFFFFCLITFPPEVLSVLVLFCFLIVWLFVCCIAGIDLMHGFAFVSMAVFYDLKIMHYISLIFLYSYSCPILSYPRVYYIPTYCIAFCQYTRYTCCYYIYIDF